MKTRVIAVTVTVMLFVSLAFAQGTQGVKQLVDVAVFRLSLDDESYFRDERIVGFELTVENGYLKGLPLTPIGWGLQINNESGWRCTVSGLVAQGAAALSKNDLERLFVIARVKGERTIPVVNLAVYTTKDFEQSTKHMLLSVKLMPFEGLK